MARTNIEIDDELITRVMNRYGLKSKRATVGYALRRIDVKPMTLEESLAMQGSGWDGDLNEMRQADPAVAKWIEDQDRERDAAA